MENLVNFQQLSAVFSQKKVFLTGHTGFKGAWLASMLHALGADVRGYALDPEYKDGLFDLIAPLQIIDDVRGDIRDKDHLQKELLAYQPEFIFHLAAQPLVRRSYEQPSETFGVNVLGTAHLLEAAQQLPGPCSLVVITTDKVYENKEADILYAEDDALGGYDPYSASKACTELVVNSFRRSFFNPMHFDRHGKAVSVARAGNVIGGGDWSRDRIVPDIIRYLRQGRPVEVRNPGAIRPWQHVLEPLSGYLLLAAKLQQQPLSYSKAYNFGPEGNDHLTVKTLVENAIHSWGEGSWQDVSDPSQLHEAGILKLDIQRAKTELGWRPKMNALTAIQWTVNWYKTPPARQTDYSFDQIRQYLAV